MMGADGAFFVIRRELYTPTPPDIIDDMHTSLNVVFQGKRLVSWPRVRAFEKTAADRSDEFRRKVRIACRAFNCYRLLRAQAAPPTGHDDLQILFAQGSALADALLALGGMAFLVAGPVARWAVGHRAGHRGGGGRRMLLGWFGIRYFKMGFELMVSLLATFLGVIELCPGVVAIRLGIPRRRDADGTARPRSPTHTRPANRDCFDAVQE